jgi:uncharacterized membrane protein (GlpM family)
MIYFFIDQMAYSNQLVQAAAAFVVAGFTLLMCNFFVFPQVGAKQRLPS